MNTYLITYFLTCLRFFNQQSAGIVAFVALFLWDNKKEEEQLAQISRDETLSRLPLRLSTNRVVELVQLRDTARPVSITLELLFILAVFFFFFLFFMFLVQMLQPSLDLGYFSR